MVFGEGRKEGKERCVMQLHVYYVVVLYAACASSTYCVAISWNYYAVWQLAGTCVSHYMKAT